MGKKNKRDKRTQLPPLEHSHLSRELKILPRNKEKTIAEKTNRHCEPVGIRIQNCNFRVGLVNIKSSGQPLAF